MLALLISLFAPAHAITPAGAAWSSAGVAVGAGATMFVPGAIGYGDVVTRLNPPNCGEFPDCEGYGFAVMLQSSVVGGAGAYGLSAAGAGAISHALTVKHGTWGVLAAGGATALVSTGLTAAGLAVAGDGNTEVMMGLLGAGFLGNVVGVPLAVGLASGGAAKVEPTEKAPVKPALTGIGVAPTDGGASFSLSMSF